MSDLTPFQNGGSAPVSHSGPDRNSRSGGAEGVGGAEAGDLRAFLALLRRRVWLVLGVTAAVFGIALYTVLRQEPLYRATATVRLQDERGAMTGGIAGGAMEQVMGTTVDPILSQLQELKSRGVAREVVKRTGLRLRPQVPEVPVDVFEDVQVPDEAAADTLSIRFAGDGYRVRGSGAEAEAAYGQSVQLPAVEFAVTRRPEGVDEAALLLVSEWQAIEMLLDGLQASIREKTDVIDVSFTANDPVLAQRVVNTLVSVFREVSANQSQEQARRRRIFIEEQLAETDAALQAAQRSLSDFQQREAVFSSRERAAAQQEALIQLEMRREELAADRDVLKSLLAGFNRGGEIRHLRTLISTPSVAENKIIVGLYEQLNKLSSARDSVTAGAWGSAASNPDVQRLNTLMASARAQLIDAVGSHASALDARIAALDQVRARNIAELRALPETGAEEGRLVQGVETIRKVADQLREEYQKARIAEAVEAGQVEVVDLAALSREPIASGKGLKLAFALILGLMLGSGSAYVLEHLNTSIRRKEDLEVLRIPGLAVIPQFASTGAVQRRSRLSLLGMRGRNGNGSTEALTGGGAQELVTISDLRSSGAEAYRTLRTNLIFSRAVQSLRTLVITSSAPSEGKTTTSSNLAVAFAQQGMRVLIVDCDLRKGRLNNVFGVPRAPGLTQLMLGFNDAPEVIHATAVDGLFVLPSGTLPPNPAELLGGERMREILKSFGEEFDLIILDTPPLLAAVDAAILGKHADGVLLVVRAGHTDRAAAQHAVEQLRAVGVHMLGAVLNDPDATMPAYGGYYYYEYYGAEA